MTEIDEVTLLNPVLLGSSFHAQTATLPGEWANGRYVIRSRETVKMATTESMHRYLVIGLRFDVSDCASVI